MRACVRVVVRVCVCARACVRVRACVRARVCACVRACAYFVLAFSLIFFSNAMLLETIAA